MSQAAAPLEIVHTDGHDPAINSLATDPRLRLEVQAIAAI